MTTYYAHTLTGLPKSKWEPLERHLAEVSLMARQFAGAFGADAWADLLGKWHDLGKYSDAFQKRLNASDPDASEQEQSAGRVDHSTFGVRHAVAALSPHIGQIIAFCIAGHHGGLPDSASDDVSHQASTLTHRLDPKHYQRVEPVNVQIAPPPKLFVPIQIVPTKICFDIAFFTRILFSCLIDADRTATEAFCNPPRAAERRRTKPLLVALRDSLSAFLHLKNQSAEPTPINRQRANVLSDCLCAASKPAGFFSLNVPTGGGKTLSSLAFALNHAIEHDLRRVIVAIPFTSIIEQTAGVYREALGDLAMLGLIEHHSAIEPKKQTRENEIASENWDAPLIVTTNVQLYESLFAAATTPCRKLHRLVKSVIILDEAQTIPVELLKPTLTALKELVENYGCTVVLCTATQPALARRNGEFEIGIDPSAIRPIIADEISLHAALRRVKVSRIGRLTDSELAERIANESAALCVVNSRPHAAKIFDELISRAKNKESYLLRASNKTLNAMFEGRSSRSRG